MECQISDAFDSASYRVSAQLLYQTALSQPNSSLVVSPYSVLISLATLYIGTAPKTTTRNQLTKFLAEPSKQNEEEVVYHYALTMRRMNYSNGVQLFNRLYLDRTVDLTPSIIEIMHRAFLASIRLLGFSQNAYLAVREINKDIAAQTHNQKTMKLLDDITAPKMIMASVVRFKAEWARKFEPKNTKPRPFYTAKGDQKQVPMMNAMAWFPHSDADDTVTVLGIPYAAGAKATMYILLPKKRYGLLNLLTALGKGKKCLNQLFDAVKRRKVDATIPKFEVESSAELSPILSKLSLGSLYEKGANFRQLAKNEPLSLNGLVQNAFISVTEDGTDAFTSANLTRIIAKNPKQFVANHPFAYFVVVETGIGLRQILLSGVVADFPK